MIDLQLGPPPAVAGRGGAAPAGGPQGDGATGTPVEAADGGFVAVLDGHAAPHAPDAPPPEAQTPIAAGPDTGKLLHQAAADAGGRIPADGVPAATAVAVAAAAAIAAAPPAPAGGAAAAGGADAGRAVPPPVAATAVPAGAGGGRLPAVAAPAQGQAASGPPPPAAAIGSAAAAPEPVPGDGPARPGAPAATVTLTLRAADASAPATPTAAMVAPAPAAPAGEAQPARAAAPAAEAPAPAAPRAEGAPAFPAAAPAPAQTPAGASDAPAAAGRGGLIAPHELARDLGARLQMAVREGGRELLVSLRPPELGHLTIRVTVQDGVLQAQILADRPEAARMLQQSLSHLGATLGDLGYALEGLDVAYGGRDPWGAGRPGPDEGDAPSGEVLEPDGTPALATTTAAGTAPGRLDLLA